MMSDKYKRYEAAKKRLPSLKLTPWQYTEIIRIIADILGI